MTSMARAEETLQRLSMGGESPHPGRPVKATGVVTQMLSPLLRTPIPVRILVMRRGQSREVNLIRLPEQG